MEFVKKPIPIHAVRWTGKNTPEVKAFVKEHGLQGGAEVAGFVKRRGPGVTKALWEGQIADDDWSEDITAAVYDFLHETWVGVKDGQWIMRGTEGELYPCEDDGTGEAPLNYAPRGIPFELPDLRDRVKEADPLADMLRQEASASMKAAERALPDGVKDTPHGLVKETPQERGDRHAKTLIEDVFENPKVTEVKELADFNPATSHLHTCGKNEGSDSPCTEGCIHWMYAGWEEDQRVMRAPWIDPFVRYVNEDVAILDFNKFPVPPRLQEMLGMVFVQEGENDGAQ